MSEWFPDGYIPRPCEKCGELIRKRPKDSILKWLCKTYCSQECARTRTRQTLAPLPSNRAWRPTE